MERVEQFEQMLADVRANYDTVTAKLDKLKAEGRTKTVTYRELLGNRMMLRHMLDLYKAYGLMD